MLDKNSQLSFLVAYLIDGVRINAVSPAEKAGKTIWIKRRRFLMDWVIWCGNIFLRLSHSRIIMFPDCKQWLEWELHSFRLLYEGEIQGGLEGNRGFWVETLPGVSFLRHLDNGNLTLPMLRAAASEFRRVHSIFCPQLGDYWSHGDPHLTNVLYNSVTEKAYLIDFETQHERSLNSQERHADDLLVFVLDLLGRSPSLDWFNFSLEFLKSYGREDVLQSLKKRLVVPSGCERILWATRTNYMPLVKLEYCLEYLKEAL